MFSTTFCVFSQIEGEYCNDKFTVNNCWKKIKHLVSKRREN